MKGKIKNVVSSLCTESGELIRVVKVESGFFTEESTPCSYDEQYAEEETCSSEVYYNANRAGYRGRGGQGYRGGPQIYNAQR